MKAIREERTSERNNAQEKPMKAGAVTKEYFELRSRREKPAIDRPDRKSYGRRRKELGVNGERGR